MTMSPLSAEPVPGDEDDIYQRALELWINNDEENSIPALSGLAKKGNAAAKVLLTQIDKTPDYWGPWVANLTRDQRIELLRVPGGFSGRNWMKTIDDIPMARDQLNARRVDVTTKTATDFLDLGELRAARVALFFLDGRQGPDIAELADDTRFPPSLRFLIWQEWRRNDEQADRITREIEALDGGNPQRAIMGGQVSEKAFEGWLSHSPQTKPLRALCQTHCPGSVSSCTQAAYLGVDDYWNLNMLKTDQDWINSPRGMSTLLSLINMASGLHNPSWPFEENMARMTSTDFCFANLLEKEAARF